MSRIKAETRYMEISWRNASCPTNYSVEKTYRYALKCQRYLCMFHYIFSYRYKQCLTTVTNDNDTY